MLITDTCPNTMKRCGVSLLRGWWWWWQACKIAGGGTVVSTELVPQILPLFACSGASRRDFGSALPSPRASAPQAGQADDSAFWDLVYVLYPELVEAVGSVTAHQLVHLWRPLEAGLAVSVE